jgi:uncharacterized protein
VRPSAPFRKAIALFLGLILCAAPLSARAEAPVPSPWPDFYYYDEPGILDETVRADILAQNGPLAEKYGVQLAVMAVNSLPAGDYAQRVAYLRSVMDSWQVGGAQGRGMILAVSVADESYPAGDYIAVTGAGLKDAFPTEGLKTLLDTYLEPDFAAGAYGAGVSKFLTAAAAQAETYCAGHPELFVQETSGKAAAPREKKSSAGQIVLWVCLGVAGAVLLACVALFLMANYGGGRRRRGRHGVHRGRPVITPPRTTIMHYESRPTLHIRSSGRTTGVYRNQQGARSRGGKERHF